MVIKIINPWVLASLELKKALPYIVKIQIWPGPLAPNLGSFHFYLGVNNDPILKFQLKKEPKRSRSSASEATLKSPNKMPHKSGQENPAQKTGAEMSGLLSPDHDVDV